MNFDDLVDDKEKSTDFDSLVDDNHKQYMADGGAPIIAAPITNAPTASAVPDFDSLVDDSQKPKAPQEASKGEPHVGMDFDSLQDDSVKYGSPVQQLGAGIEGFGRGIAGPLAPMAEKALGVPAEDILARQQQNPITAGVGEAAGFAGSLMTGVGEGALVGKLGEGIANAIGKGENLASLVGRGVARGSLENALLTGGDEISKMVVNDPNTSAQTAVSNIGLSAVLGGSLGGVLGGMSPLLKAKGGLGKLGQIAEDFKAEINDQMANPDKNEAITKELGDHFNNMNSYASDVYGPQNLKAQNIAKLMPEMSDKIADHTGEVMDKLGSAVDKLGDDPHASLLKDEVQKYRNAVQTSDPGQIFDATQNLKQQLQEYSKYNANLTPLNEKKFRNTAKSLAFDLRESLEDKSVWGDAAKIQQDTNRAFSKYKPALDDFMGIATKDVAGNPEIDPGKIQTIINQADKPSGSIKLKKLSNYLDASEKYKDVINGLYEGADLESPVSNTPLNNTARLLKDQTTGGKLAQLFIKYGLSDAGSKGIAGGIGASIGHATGVGGEIGALLGTHALEPLVKSTLPAIVKPILNTVSNGVGVHSATNYIASVAKGDEALTRGAKSIFRDTGFRGTVDNISEGNIKKLDKLLQDYQENPEKMLDLHKNIGHYLPDHAIALGTLSSNAVNYLNGLRPNRTKQNPLDADTTPSNMQKASYTKALQVAQQPMSVYESLKRGTLDPSELVTLKTLYPSLYNSMVSKINDEMVNALKKKTPIPYKTKLGVSMFVGQPMDSSMTPNSIQAAQISQQLGKQQQPQNNQKQSKSKAGSKAFEKTGSRFQTSEQAAEADQLKR